MRACPSAGRVVRERMRCIGTPSWVLLHLQEVGTEAMLAHRMAMEPMSPPASRAVRRQRDARAELYDDMLARALDQLDLVRGAMGDVAADVCEGRYVDGMGWRECGEQHGLNSVQAHKLAHRALRWLDGHPDEAMRDMTT